MYFIRIYFILFTLLFQTQAFLQAQKISITDSLQNILKQRVEKDSVYVISLLAFAREVRLRDTEKAVNLAQNAVVLAQELADVKLEGKARNILGICYGMQNRYAESIQSFNRTASISKKIGYLTLEGESYNNLGIVYKRLNDYPKSLTYHFKALQIYDSLMFSEGIARSSNNLGSLYKQRGELNKAKIYYNKALKGYAELKNDRGFASAQLNLGELYLETNDFELSYNLLDSALNYANSHNLLSEKVLALMSLGELYFKKKEYDRAEFYFVPAYEEAERQKMLQSMYNSLFFLSQIDLEEGNINQSLQLAIQVQNIADSVNIYGLKSNAEKLLSSIYQNNGDWEKALKHYKKHTAWEDSILNEKTATEFKAQQVQMEVYEKNQQLETQALELAFLNERLTLEIRWRWALGIACCLILLVGVLYFQKYRQRNIFSEELETRNLLITEQKEEIDAKNEQLEKQFKLRKETDDTINYFATSLFDKNTIDEILWDVAKNCISRLGLEDCVIYLVDNERNVLIQKAAYGPKNPKDFEINQPLEIPIGEGIVGSVAQKGIAEIINDTSIDERYIVDDASRLSELAVPLIQNEKVIGVIDSEHPEKHFFTQYHLDALKTITAICTSKIAHAEANEASEKAEAAQIEAAHIKQLDQVKSQFFANISHEFRTPLNLIMAPLQNKQQPIPVFEVETMRRNAKRLLRLVNQLLDLAKIEVGLMQLSNKNIEVYSFIKNIALSFLPLANTKDIHYHINIPERDAIISFDPDKAEKIVYNLLSNAFKFTPKGGSVNINMVIENTECLRITITDSGIGIPKKLKGKIFERFYQVDATQTRAYEGTGIGLALTKELVDLLKGTITLDSEENKGSIFTINFPIKIVDDDAEMLEIIPQDVLGIKSYYQEPQNNYVENTVLHSLHNENAPTVLFVEDNGDLRDYLKRKLSTEYHMIEAENGKQGLKIAQEKIPDLIVTDIMMPVMDGVSMIKQLREDNRTNHIPIILLTARDDEDTKIKGFETGAEQFLIKPFELDELRARIKSLLSQRENLRQKFNRESIPQLSEATQNSRDALFLKKLIKTIEDNMSNEAFTTEELQREIAMSRMQLHRKLKALTNQSTSEFIRRVKMQKAAQYLKQADMQIAEVAYKVGFNHLSYFSKCFKEQFGVLPSAYAKE
ncbi:MAG: ATP-binding protein [Bacteroidota bacterium]